MPQHKGVSCDLLIDGEKAAEYGLEVSGNTCKVHVVGIEGAEYGFQLRFETGAERHAYHCFIDGQRAIYRTSASSAVEIHHAMIQDGDSTLTKFKLKFGKIQTGKTSNWV